MFSSQEVVRASHNGSFTQWECQAKVHGKTLAGLQIFLFANVHSSCRWHTDSACLPVFLCPSMNEKKKSYFLSCPLSDKGCFSPLGRPKQSNWGVGNSAKNVNRITKTN